jgi:integrase
VRIPSSKNTLGCRHEISGSVQKLAVALKAHRDGQVFGDERTKRTDLPRIRFHDLRHSAATLLLGLGVHPKIVSEMLGHSQIAITLDLYSHVTATMQQEAMRAFEGLFGSQEGATEH